MIRFETRAQSRFQALGALFQPLAPVALAAFAASGCGNSSSPNQGSSGSGTSGSSTGTASSGTAVATTGSASGAAASGTSSGAATTGVVATAGSSAGAATGTASGDGTSGTAASGISSGTLATSGSSGASTGSSQPTDDGGAAMIDAGGRTLPTCAKPTPPPNEVGGAQGSRPIECDVLLQALDFEDAYSYPSPPGSIKVTTFGNAIGLYEINNCSPYCYAKDLTVGVDIVGGGSQTDLQGEIILEFPSSGPGLADGGAYPIPVADKSRSIYSWITFDGPAKPEFEIDTQLVVETATGIVPAVQTRQFFKPNTTGQNPFGPFNVANNYSYSNGSEFAYAPITTAAGFPNGLVNVTGIGFRIVAKATAGQSWHGVLYIDHVQLRGPGPQNPDGWPAGYPYHDAGL